MFVCAFSLWTAVPAAMIFALPRVTHRDLGLPAVLVAVFVGMLAMTKVVAVLNALYCRVMAVPPPPPAPPRWRRSFSEPTPATRHNSVLETVVAVSAIAAVVTFVVWFLFFAHCGQGLCAA
jgi:hypothetical protein